MSMRCADCGHENRPGVRFCTGCGVSLMQACPGCGAPCEPADRFCGACGAALQAECPACGAPLTSGDRFCGACGASFDLPASHEGSEEPPTAVEEIEPYEVEPVATREGSEEPPTAVEEIEPYEEPPGVAAEPAPVLDAEPDTQRFRVFEAPPGDDAPASPRRPAAQAAEPLPIPEPPPLSESGPPPSISDGRYEIQSFIGEGLMKRVYLGHDTQLDRPVAIGLLKAEGLDEAGRARLHREVRVMGRLGTHPNIVTLYDLVEDGGHLYVVSQYMPRGDLADRLRSAVEHRLRRREALRVGIDLCRGLEHAHAAGVIHRDIKPANVFFADDGSAKLGDFGLALAVDRTRLTQAGMMVGTVAYMPPEQALGRDPDARSDLYSLGAILYEMLCGEPPFAGDDVVSVLSQHINSPPVAPTFHRPDLPPELESTILELLGKDPDRRPESARLVRQRLELVQRELEQPARAEEPSSVAAAEALERLSTGVFVGRSRELERLVAALEDALSGGPKLAVLVGEPGAGKTRTAEEFALAAQRHGARVLWGRCPEREGAPAYAPWLEIVRSLLGERPEAEIAEDLGPLAVDLASIYPEIREALPDLGLPPRLEPPHARFRVFEAVTTLLRGASRRQPLVLVLDDLHWADRPSLLLLEFLARELGPARLLVVGTYSELAVGREHLLGVTLSELERDGQLERIRLRGLGSAELSRTIEKTAHIEPPEALVAAVYRVTDGNPLYVSEVVRLLASRGRLENAAAVGSWDAEVPHDLRDVIRRRLRPLSDESSEVLGMAAALGGEFELGVLGRVLEVSEAQVLGLCDEARRCQLVCEIPEAPGRYRFPHALVRDTLYATLSPSVRVRLHVRIARVLEALGGDGTHLAEIAHHRFVAAQGGEVAHAVDASLAAADWARERLAFEDAAAHCEQALETLKTAEAPDRKRTCEIVVRLAELFDLAGDRERARKTALQGSDLAREVREAELEARAALAFWGASRVSADAAVIDLLERALASLGPGESIVRVKLLDRLATEISFAGDLERVRALFDEAVAMARRTGDPATLASAVTCAWIAFPVDQPDRWVAAADEATELARRADHPGLEQHATGLRLQGLLMQGDAPGVRAAFERECELAEEIRTPWAHFPSALHRAALALLWGNLDEAEALADEALAIGQRASARHAEEWHAIQRDLCAFARGSAPPVAPLKALVERVPNAPETRARLALRYLRSGQEEQAREQFEILAQGDFAALDALEMTGAWPSTAQALALVSVGLDDARRADLLYGRLLPFEHLCVTVGNSVAYLGCMARQLGLLAGLLGRYADAEQHFIDAIERETEMEARCFLAWARADYARMLLQRDDEGDRENAIELTNGALELAQALGMKRLVEEGVARKAAVQGIERVDITSSVDAIAASIGELRPDFASHAARDGTVTLMFSDMEGFAEMTERLGDRAAHAIIQEHNRIVREQCTAHGGHEVELQGDGFLLAFKSARSAILCAMDLQRAFARWSEEHPDEPIRVHIGLHTGEAIKDRDGFFGMTVIQAARIASEAKGGEILLSLPLRNLLEIAGDLSFAEARRVVLKGLTGVHELSPLVWQD